VDQAFVGRQLVGEGEGVGVAKAQRGGGEVERRAGLFGEEADRDHAGVGELEGKLV
jgi:hypothetical protein